MGQYYRAVNITKREYVDPWDLDIGGKWWEWCANRTAAIFPFLLWKSSAGEYINDEGEYIDDEADDLIYPGRWAGDIVYLVGDYDDSGLYYTAEEEYTNISLGVAREFNRFIVCDERKVGPVEDF